MRLKGFLSVQEKDFASVGKKNTVDFTPLFEMIFILMLKMEELRGAGERKEAWPSHPVAPPDPLRWMRRLAQPRSPRPLIPEDDDFPSTLWEPYAC